MLIWIYHARPGVTLFRGYSSSCFWVRRSPWVRISWVIEPTGRVPIVSFHHVSLETAMHNASHWNEINVLNNQTDIVRQHTDAYSPSGVNHYDSDYGDTWWVGMWNCMVSYGGSICVQGRVRYNIGVYNESNVNYARSIACHEQGHAIGLAHSTGGSSCMFSSPAQERPTYAPHDIAHINALY